MSSDYKDDFTEDDDLERDYDDRPDEDDEIEIPRIGKNDDYRSRENNDPDDDFFKDEDFEDCYSAKGRNAISPAFLACVTLLQFRENLSDPETSEAVVRRLVSAIAFGLAGYHFWREWTG